MEKPADFEQFNSKAELLKVIAHPVRLCIVKGLLEQGECNVSRMQNCLEMPQSTISQHLGKLRDARIIKARREGVEVYYQLVDEEIKKIIQAIF